jgi:hypothetical protein
VLRKLIAAVAGPAVAVVLLAGSPHAAPRSTQGQAAISVISDEVRNEFPRGATFAVSFSAPAPSKEVRLRYHIAPDGVDASAVATCTGDTTITCTFTMTSGAGVVLIPGAEITYRWDISDTVGDQISTGDKLYVHEDTRFTFQTITKDNVTLHFHAGNASRAQGVLDAAAETLQRVGQLEQAEVTFPVKVYLYATAEEMQPAIAPGGPGRGVQVLGEVVFSDTAMVSEDVATLDITRHEVAHIVTGVATKGPFGIAGWLNEGISVFSQTRPLAGHDSALQQAINADRVLSMKELNSSASGSTGATVGLYYGQAGSIVKFLVDTYGADKFAQLLKTFKDGSTPDKAYQAVYGFDQLGLENAWRESVGLGPRAASATSTPKPREARTATPVARATGDASSSGDSNVVTIAIIVALAALVLAAVVGAATVVRRRM